MKALRSLTALVLIVILLTFTIPAAAQCSVDDPDCPIDPPQSQEIEPDSGGGDDLVGEAAVPGVLTPVESVPLPFFVEPAPFSPETERPPDFETLEVPVRYQNPSDVSCGIQALGMAMEGFDGATPTYNAILGFLQGERMMYEFGTGVEELAFAAQSFGYKGSQSFHGATLESLLKEITANRPVVVALGTDAGGQPGHFVTVTGFSSDGQWVAFNDPTRGKQVMRVEEFLRLWTLQGNSGVFVRQELSSSTTKDLLPLIATAAALMAAVSTTPQALKRKGIGGRLVEHDGVVNTGTEHYPPPPRFRWARRVVPKYGWKDFLVTKTKEVPNMVRKRVKVGARVWYEKRQRYKTVQVDRGRWAYRKVTRYRSVRYVRYYRRYRVRKRYHYRRGRRWYTGYRYEWRKKPVYGKRPVKYTSWERYWKPKLVHTRIPDGYDFIRHEEPVYKTVVVQDGSKKIRTQETERHWVQVGTQVKWVLEKIIEALGEQDSRSNVETTGGREMMVTNPLKIRATPGMDGMVITYASVHERVTLTGKVKQMGATDWYQVVYEDRYKGKVTGWVSGNYLIDTGDNPAGDMLIDGEWLSDTVQTNYAVQRGGGRLMTVTANWLVMRSGPTTQHPVVREIPWGRAVRWTGCYVNIKGTNWYEVNYDGKRGWVASKYLTSYKPPKDDMPAPAPGYLWVPLKETFSFSYYYVTDTESYEPEAHEPDRFNSDYKIKWKYGGQEIKVPYGALFSPAGVAMQGSGVVEINGEPTFFKLDNPTQLKWKDKAGKHVWWEDGGWVNSAGKRSFPVEIMNPEKAVFTIGSQAKEFEEGKTVAAAPELRGATLFSPEMEKYSNNKGIFEVKDGGGAFPPGSTRIDVYFPNRDAGRKWYEETELDRRSTTIYILQEIPREHEG
ncbi:MAG: SH3 domain-containing protein [Anaerolineales bacterium]|nr:SH3 domain-containing protein [Anaerolineales bacterium]